MPYLNEYNYREQQNKKQTIISYLTLVPTHIYILPSDSQTKHSIKHSEQTYQYIWNTLKLNLSHPFTLYKV